MEGLPPPVMASGHGASQLAGAPPACRLGVLLQGSSRRSPGPTSTGPAEPDGLSTGCPAVHLDAQHAPRHSSAHARAGEVDGHPSGPVSAGIRAHLPSTVEPQQTHTTAPAGPVGAAAGTSVAVDLLSLPRAAVATALGTATALRGVRVFHPHGRTHDAVLTVTGVQGSTPSSAEPRAGVSRHSPAPARRC